MNPTRIHASLKWQAVSSKWTGVYCSPMHTSSALQYVSTTTSLCACLGYERHYVFVRLRLQYKWNQLSSYNSGHTSCIHKGLHAGKWPDLVTSKPDAFRTLGYHWTDCTGTTLADAIAQRSFNGNPVLIWVIGTHWKTTGATSTLGCHCNQTGWC